MVPAKELIPPFSAFPKIARWSREVVITEKLDGTNASVWVNDTGTDLMAASRNRWLAANEPDHFGFRTWVEANKAELLKLGPGLHFGEWWGPGIGRGYGTREKRFSLFNTHRWGAIDEAGGESRLTTPSVCHVVPKLWSGPADQLAVGIEAALVRLRETGSLASPGFMRPEGIVIFHTAANVLFKKTLEKDDKPKGAA